MIKRKCLCLFKDKCKRFIIFIVFCLAEYTMSQTPPITIDNEIVSISFNHTQGMISAITYKKGSNHNLVDQSWNSRNGFGLGRIQNETGTICTSFLVDSNSAFFEYTNQTYGRKTFKMMWGLGIGFEMEMTYYLSDTVTHAAGSLWLPGGDNGVPYDSLIVFNPDSGRKAILITYTGSYSQLFSGVVSAAAMYDSRYSEIAGYRFPRPLSIGCGTGASMDGPYYIMKGIDTITVGFAVKDTSDFWSWAYGYDHDGRILSLILSDSAIGIADTLKPTAIVQNAGKFTDTVYGVCQIGIQYSDTSNAVLRPLEKDTMVFRKWMPILSGTYNARCSVWVKNDEYERNNTLLKTVVVKSSSGPQIFSVTPNRGGNTGYVTAAIKGSGFKHGANVILRTKGQPDIVSDSVVSTVDSTGTSISAILNLDGSTVGTRDLVITNPDGGSSTFYGAFTIEKGVSTLWVDISGRDAMGPHRSSDYQVTVYNKGNNDVPSTMLLLTIPGGIGVKLHNDGIDSSFVPVLTDQLTPKTYYVNIGPFMENSNKQYQVTVTTNDQFPVNSFSIVAAVQALDGIEGALVAKHIETNKGFDGLRKTLRLTSNCTADNPLEILNVVVWNGWVVDGKTGKIGGRNHPFFQLNDGNYYDVEESNGQLSVPPPMTPSQLADFENGIRNQIAVDGCYKDGDSYSFGYQAFANGFIGLCKDQYECFSNAMKHAGTKQGTNECMSWPNQMAANSSCKINNSNGFFSPQLNTPALLNQQTDAFLDAFGVQKALLPSYMRKPSEIPNCAMQNLAKQIYATMPIKIEKSLDPNDKSGPSGYGTKGFTTFDHPFPYNIYFENIDTATAPAENITIIDTLDPNLNWKSLVFDTSSHKPTTITFDTTKGIIAWSFTGINLPPNKTPPQGEGWVRYHVDPKPNLPNLAQISNRAWITFDQNKPMATRVVVNTNDTIRPISKVKPVIAQSADTSFKVEWAGSDSGSGIRSYSIYVSKNDSPFVCWITTDSTKAVFKANNGTSYKFYSTAVDNAGNMELTHDSADARVKVAVNVKMFRLAQLPKIFMFGNYPNPFKRTTSFKFAVPLAAPSLDENSKRKVSIKIYSIQGRLIRTLVEGPVKVGYHTAIFDGKGDKHQNLGIGAYLARMEADGFTKTIKLILAR